MNDFYLVASVSFILGMIYVKLIDYLWNHVNRDKNV